MFENTFDPYQALINTDRNLQAVIAAHNLLAKRVEEQGQVIDTLIQGLHNSNKANELLMREMSHNIQSKLQEVK
jgi:hypothetical protein